MPHLTIKQFYPAATCQLPLTERPVAHSLTLFKTLQPDEQVCCALSLSAPCYESLPLHFESFRSRILMELLLLIKALSGRNHHREAKFPLPITILGTNVNNGELGCGSKVLRLHRILPSNVRLRPCNLCFRRSVRASDNFEHESAVLL